VNETELLQSFRPWLRTVAAGFPETQPSRVEDLAQEGWIAVWRALNKNKDDRPLEPFLKQCAINRMRDVFSQWTAASRNMYMINLIDTSPANDWLWSAFHTDLGGIEEAYHHGEIMQAVNRLPKTQRQYVIRKFWHCWDPTALDLYFTNHRKVWREAKITLSKELAHLGA
jgi:DNA-directed RNA polymerase specialized sigma24 family protein